ncbi:AAA family ATPase [Phenylobacterium sp.]|uniref:AAA family ATPase n=1 Tax=Phenylobacterium sp. TaxID=1871053 RepID=UPI0025FDDAF9|nr:AAA family ATPase [Phenylobacterium sp.]
MIEKLNFFVFTGGPGVGKTALIRHLEGRGEHVVEETHRAVIAEQVAGGGRATPWDDHAAYCELCVRRDLRKFDALSHEAGRVFFDRGILDGFDPRWDAPPALIAAARARRYNPRVFVFPPWREIYRTDAERRQDWAEAEATFGRILAGLDRFSYRPVIVPRATVEARAAFVLELALRASVSPT